MERPDGEREDAEVGLVRRIDASHFDPGTAYMAVDYHLVDNRDPFLAKTTDFGQTWTRIDATLPKGHPLDYALSIAENPNRSGMLFAGTGHGFFYSRNDGTDVDAVQGPAAGRAGELDRGAEERAGSRGRDLRPRAVDPARSLADGAGRSRRPAGGAAAATSRGPATRTREGGTAEFVFALRPRPPSPITVDVLGADGAVISTSQVIGRAGLNEASWNCCIPPPDRVVLRSTAARRPAHLGGRPLAESRAAGRALGPRRGELAAARGARQVHGPP